MSATTAPSPPADGVYSDIVHVFEPNSSELPELRPYLRDLWNRRAFIVELANAEVKGPRTSTIMGEFWALLDPLFQAFTYVFLYTVIRGSGAGGARSSDFITAIIFGVFLFNYSRVAVTDGGRSILKGKGLMLNSTFPWALLPTSEVYKGFLLTIPSIAVYAAVHAAFRAPIGQGIVLLPLLFMVQTATSLGLALLFATATVLIKDMSNVLTYVIRLLLFATPIVYPVTALSPALRSILGVVNPFFCLFSAYQSIILGDIPTPGAVFVAMVWSVIALVVGASVFLRHERSLALHL